MHERCGCDGTYMCMIDRWSTISVPEYFIHYLSCLFSIFFWISLKVKAMCMQRTFQCFQYASACMCVCVWSTLNIPIMKAEAINFVRLINLLEYFTHLELMLAPFKVMLTMAAQCTQHIIKQDTIKYNKRKNRKETKILIIFFSSLLVLSVNESIEIEFHAVQPKNVVFLCYVCCQHSLVLSICLWMFSPNTIASSQR